MSDSDRTIISQGMTRPGIVQGQLWREDHPRRDHYDALGPDGEHVPVFVLGGYQPPPTFGITMAEAVSAIDRMRVVLRR